MKNNLFFMLFVVSFFVKAQVGVNTLTPAAGSILDVSSTDKGMLVPRLDITNLGAIGPVTGGSPAGLLAYNTNVTTGIGFHFWNGSRWVRMDGESGWKLTGNAATASDFLGTTNSEPLRIRTNNLERMQVNADGRIIMNTTTFITGDILRVVAGAGQYAVNGYGTTGAGVYGEATTGFGVYGDATSGIGVLGLASSGVGTIGDGTGTTGTGTGDGVWGFSLAGAGVYGEATTGDGVYGNATNTDGTGVYGVANTGTLAYGVWGSSSTGVGVRGSANSAASLGGRFSNTSINGTGVMISGQNAIGLSFGTGGGAAIVGTSNGLLAVGRTLASGWGVLATGNDITTVSFLGQGGGGAFTGNQWGVYANATISGSGTTDRAAFVGQFNENSSPTTVYLGARIGGNNYKVLGTIGSSVSTTMQTRDGERILFAPEAPENWFFDIGEAQLVNGKATVNIDPLFVDCISEAVPFKVFVQGAEDVLGSIIVKRNQNAKTFELTDTGGNSNGIVQYKIYGIWKGKENLRLPVYTQPFEVEKLKLEEVKNDETEKIAQKAGENGKKEKKYNKIIKVKE